MIFKEVSARDIRFEKIQIGPVYNIPAARPAFSYRGIAGVPPPTEQSTIQQRAPLVEAIYTKLTQPGINAFVLTGIGGVGKSTLAALLCRYVQAQLSTGKGFFQAPPLWLSIDQAATVADVIGTMFQRLDTPLSVLDNLSPAGQVEALFTLLDTLALPRLIVLDQFDNLLDWATGSALPTQLGVGELLDALNSRPWSSSCRVLLTSRPFPKGTHEAPPTCLHAYPIDGLTQQEGLALFRSRGIQAPEADMNKALTFCDGHPLSLVLLMTLIQLYGIPLGDLLAEPTLWIEDITTNLLDAVFRRLTEEQRTVLHAMSVYRTAVPVAAITPFLPQSSSQQISVSLRSLLVQQLIQPAGNGSYQVHAVVARYVQTHFVEGDQRANQQALHAAHARAAHYYLDQAQASALPREQRRRLNDIQGIIEAVWQYTQAAQWQDAYALMEQEDLLNDLSLWGGNIQLLDLCQWFLPQREWQPEPGQAITIYLYLGGASSLLGKKQQALEYYQQALALSREVGNRKDEGTTLNNIGAVYDDLGNKQQALEYYQQALTISREVKDRRDESGTLNNIGWVYDHLGDKRQALEYYQQALAIWREVGDRGGEGSSLNNIGRVYYALGNKQRALEYCRQALAIWREVGDRRGEGIALSSIGGIYDALGNKQQALEYYQQALALSREVGDRQVEGTRLNNMGGVYYALGNEQQALEYYQQALALHQEVGDHKGEGGTLSNIGLVYDALGDKQQALEYYQQALALSREVGDRKGEGVTLNNIGKVYNDQGDKQQALEYYQQALSIRREVGDREGEGATLNNIGAIYDGLGDKQQALEYYQQALALSREVGNHEGEGVTQWNIATLALGQHHYDFALAAFLLARQCFEKTSSPRQKEVESWIDDLRRKIGKKRFDALQARIEPQSQQIFEQALSDRQAQHKEEE